MDKLAEVLGVEPALIEFPGPELMRVFNANEPGVATLGVPDIRSR